MNLLSYIFTLELTKVNSPLNGELKVKENFGKRTLYANGDEQSGGTITGMWGQAVKRIQNAEFRMKKCLILGLGGGTVIRLLNKYYPHVDITAIEFDPKMIEIAEEYFGVKSSDKLKIINADVFSWITQKNKGKFDLVIFDIYIGKFNPPQCSTQSFLKNLKSLLTPGGMILYNRHYQKDESDYQKFLQACQKIYSEVNLILPYPYSRILCLR